MTITIMNITRKYCKNAIKSKRDKNNTNSNKKTIFYNSVINCKTKSKCTTCTKTITIKINNYIWIHYIIIIMLNKTLMI